MTNSSVRRTYTHQLKETARLDPYRSQSKPKGTPQCPVCGSVSIQGRWLATARATALRPSVIITGKLKCSACRQLEDHFALGVIELHGEGWKQKKELVMNTIHHAEKIARSRNDQERVLWVKEGGDVTKVYVSLPELARRIGRELERTFHGISEYDHSTEEPYLRVRWQSDLPHTKHRPGAPLELKEKLIQTDHEVLPARKSRAFRGRSRRG